jgi:hypothetical protein
MPRIFSLSIRTRERVSRLTANCLPISSIWFENCREQAVPAGESGIRLVIETRIAPDAAKSAAFIDLIGQSKRQTVSQSATVYFQCFVLPQSANVSSFCQNFEALGYNFGYSRGGLETAKEERRRQSAHDLGGDEQRDINGPNP